VCSSDLLARMRDPRGRTSRQPEATMKTPRLVATAIVFILGGCTDDPTLVEPDSPARSVQDRASTLAASPARPIQAAGRFDALVDFTTLTLTPRGRNCLLQVKGRLVFSGTLEGPAIGQTTALVFAPSRKWRPIRQAPSLTSSIRCSYLRASWAANRRGLT